MKIEVNTRKKSQRFFLYRKKDKMTAEKEDTEQEKNGKIDCSAF